MAGQEGSIHRLSREFDAPSQAPPLLLGLFITLICRHQSHLLRALAWQLDLCYTPRPVREHA